MGAGGHDMDIHDRIQDHLEEDKVYQEKKEEAEREAEDNKKGRAIHHGAPTKKTSYASIVLIAVAVLIAIAASIYFITQKT